MFTTFSLKIWSFPQIQGHKWGDVDSNIALTASFLPPALGKLWTIFLICKDLGKKFEAHAAKKIK